MHTIIVVITGLAGATVAVLTVASALQTLVVPRGTTLITHWVQHTVRAAFLMCTRGSRDYRTCDRIMARFAPTTLVVLPVVWLSLVLAGFVLMYWSLGADSWRKAFFASGSALFTTNFEPTANPLTGPLLMVLAGLGMGLLALVISYLPSLYQCYSQRELLVTSLEVEAGSPPSGPGLLERLLRIKGLSLLDTYWSDWKHWFNELENTHSAVPILVFFRSPAPERSWVNAAGAILDSAALVLSAIDTRGNPQPGAKLCIRSGYLALRRIGHYFGMPYDPAPGPNAPIAVSRAEFDRACERLAEAGATLKADRDRAWRDFVGWRATYEGPLLRFAFLCMAPPAPWSSDRPIPFHGPPVSLRRARFRL